MDEITISVERFEIVALSYTTSQVSPPTGLAVAPVVGGGTFAAGTYFWVVTAQTALGETTVSNEATTAVALNGSANLTWTLPVGPVTHIKVYRGTVAGAENALIATLGAVTAFTDTGAAGSAATPPVANTATIQDTVLLTGDGEYRGYSFSENTGTAAAFVDIQDSDVTLTTVRLAQATFDTQGPFTDGIPLHGQVKIHVHSGSVSGSVYVALPC